MTKKISKLCLFLFFSFALTVFIFGGSFGANSRVSSEPLVISPILAKDLSIEVNKEGYGLGSLSAGVYSDEKVYLYMLKGVEGIDEINFEYKPYKSQIGLQGFVFSAISPIIPASGEYKLCAYRILCCFLFTVVLIAIIIQIRKKYGTMFAAIFGIISFISPYTVYLSRNSYWVEFTWFIPMLLGLLCLNYENKSKYIYPLFFIAIFIKCLCGYEYVSTIMMSGVIFLATEWFCNKEKRKTLFKTIFIIGIVSVAGFICAYIIHAYIYGNGNILEGLKSLHVFLVERRTFGNAADFAPEYTDSLNASVFEVLIRYFCCPPDGILMTLLAIISAIVLLYHKMVLKRDNKFEICLYIITLLSTLSWIVLAKSHSYIHVGLNMVLFYMGWVQVCFYIICEDLLRKLNFCGFLRDE